MGLVIHQKVCPIKNPSASMQEISEHLIHHASEIKVFHNYFLKEFFKNPIRIPDLRYQAKK